MQGKKCSPLKSIAKKRGTSVDQLVKNNQLADKNMILPGQKLEVNHVESPKNASSKAVKTLPETGSTGHKDLFGTTLAGGLSLALGALILGRHRKTN